MKRLLVIVVVMVGGLITTFGQKKIGADARSYN